MAGFGAARSAAFDAVARQQQRQLFQGMSAHDRHRKMVHDLVAYYGGQLPQEGQVHREQNAPVAPSSPPRGGRVEGCAWLHEVLPPPCCRPAGRAPEDGLRHPAGEPQVGAHRGQLPLRPQLVLRAGGCARLLPDPAAAHPLAHSTPPTPLGPFPRFIRSEADDAADSWEVRLAKKYYRWFLGEGAQDALLLQPRHTAARPPGLACSAPAGLAGHPPPRPHTHSKLFKEYAIADLSRHREGRVGLRWRTQREVVNGTGQFACGAKVGGVGFGSDPSCMLCCGGGACRDRFWAGSEERVHPPHTQPAWN